MANNLKTNPMFIDTFNADFIIGGSGTNVTIIKIILYSATDGDIFTLENPDTGNPAIWMVQTSDNIAREDFPSGQIFQGGLVFDADDKNSGLGSGDYVLIYTKNR
jgi:hypothetical protein